MRLLRIVYQRLIIGRRYSLNKRQSKKIRAKHEMFIEYSVSSYREKRELDRNYHEYELICRRSIKRCKKCRYFIEDNICGRFLLLLPCIEEDS